MDADKKIILNEDGQAIFEFIVFLPIILILYGIIMGIGGAINGSINQQKAVRGYAMSRIKGDPYVPFRRQINALNSDVSAVVIGMVPYVWAERLRGQTPVAACYRMPLFGLDDDEECDIQDDEIGETSPLIRVQTAFGVCGATYIFSPAEEGRVVIDFFPRGATPEGCLVSDNIN